jgi:hypothetical protein
MFILKGLPFLVAKISKNRLVPEDFEHREIWRKPSGGFAPPWMRRLARGDKRFWLPEDEVPATLPTHTKDGKETDSRSSHEKITEKDVPPPLHSPPPVGVHHHPVEVLHDENHDV